MTLGTASRMLKRRGHVVQYQSFTAGDADEQYDDTWDADTPVDITAIRQNETGSLRPYKLEDGEERYIDARFYVLRTLALKYRRTGRPPEVVDGDDTFMVLRIDERPGKAFKRLSCAQVRV